MEWISVQRKKERADMENSDSRSVVEERHSVTDDEEAADAHEGGEHVEVPVIQKADTVVDPRCSFRV